MYLLVAMEAASAHSTIPTIIIPTHTIEISVIPIISAVPSI